MMTQGDSSSKWTAIFTLAIWTPEQWISLIHEVRWPAFWLTMVLFSQFRSNLILDASIDFLKRAKELHFPGGKIVAVPPESIAPTKGHQVEERFADIPAKRPLKLEAVTERLIELTPGKADRKSRSTDKPGS